MPPSTIPSTSSAISSPGRRFGSSDQRRPRNGAARPPPHEAEPHTEGTGTAVNNIAQRIKLIYGDRAKLILGQDQGEFGPFFRARLRLPFVQHSGEAGEAA